MKAINLISLILLTKAVYNIIPLELERMQTLTIKDQGLVYVNISSNKNNEFFFFEVSFNVYKNKDKMDNITYSLSNETNFDDYHNFTNVSIYNREGYKTVSFYFKIKKLDYYNYILFYLKNTDLSFKINYSPFSVIELPKYGNLTIKYTDNIYLNLTSFKNNDKIYIQIQLFHFIDSFEKRLNEIELYALQKDELGEYESYTYERIRIGSNYKKQGNSSITFYYSFTKTNNILLINFGYLFSINRFDFQIKNAEKDELKTKKKKNNTFLYVLIPCIIIVSIIILYFLYKCCCRKCIGEIVYSYTIENPSSTIKV